ncbi:hypothetical protein [Mycobacterium intracellulare]|uniref:hypothetical protein n=1 Tax=Mycobacterium intracellulare TaxID=1767 RepID=UPI00109E5913|nr:hypothetical protein [Mycobacterium intracellulare]
MSSSAYDPMGYYDRSGQQISEAEWGPKFCSPEYKVVGWWSNSGSNPKVNGDAELIVSTVWLGMNHAFDGGLAIFETMIFGGDWNEYQMRYATEAEALSGHRRTVDDVIAGRRPWFLDDEG